MPGVQTDSPEDLLFNDVDGGLFMQHQIKEHFSCLESYVL